MDVFAGQDLVVLARYDGSGRANVVVRGRANGRDVRWSTQRVFPEDERENVFVPRLWATQRIGWLSAEKRRNGGSSEIDDEIRQLGEKFGIPTEFTSYLVQEPGRLADVDRLRRTGNQARLNDVVVTSGGRGGSATPSAAPAPQIAFESARKASSQREAKSLAAADASIDAGAGSETKRAGARMFRRDGDRWIDSRMKTDVRVYKVKAYSQSYFALLEKLPELRDAFAIGDKVLVAGNSVAIEVAPDAPELTESEMRSIVEKW
jgi:Ca-activated chloride channel family protein